MGSRYFDTEEMRRRAEIHADGAAQANMLAARRLDESAKEHTEARRRRLRDIAAINSADAEHEKRIAEAYRRIAEGLPPFG